MNETPFDAKRRLCPDGACIGVIGSSGRCSECGRDASGKPGVALVSDAPGSDDADDSAEAKAEAFQAAPADAAPASGGFDQNRRLCDDGSCVGVIGADGRCGVCGRQAGA